MPLLGCNEQNKCQILLFRQIPSLPSASASAKVPDSLVLFGFGKYLVQPYHLESISKLHFWVVCFTVWLRDQDEVSGHHPK